MTGQHARQVHVQPQILKIRELNLSINGGDGYKNDA